MSELFRACANNGRTSVIGQSETYPTDAALKKGIASVQKNAADAKIIEA
ncbi:MAG: YegP family protein [Victivallales bacterium]|nr:YegP family protein [Victivallales bacterium]